MRLPVCPNLWSVGNLEELNSCWQFPGLPHVSLQWTLSHKAMPQRQRKILSFIWATSRFSQILKSFSLLFYLYIYIKFEFRIAPCLYFVIIWILELIVPFVKSLRQESHIILVFTFFMAITPQEIHVCCLRSSGILFPLQPKFPLSVIYSFFNKYLLSTYYVLDILIELRIQLWTGYA